MKGQSKLLVILLTLMLVLSGCGGSTTPSSTPSENTDSNAQTPNESAEVTSESDNIFRMALEQDIETLDSQQNTADYTAAVAEGVTASLLREHNGEFLPDLAESYSTDDYKTWTFKIRESAAWSDGTPITAEDFAYSWKTIFTRDEAAKVYGFFEGIKNYDKVTEAMKAGKSGDELKAVADTLGVTVVDPTTLVVELDGPRPWYLSNFASSYFAPIKKDVYEANGSKYGSSIEKMAFNGPFYVSEWHYNESITLKPNTYYWDKDNINFDGVEISIVKDVEPRVNMFKEGKVNFARATSEYYQTMSDSLVTYPGSSWSYILTNQARLNTDGEYVNKAISDLLANRDFIDALNYSIDRTTLYGAVINNPSYAPTNIIVADKIPLNNGTEETFGDGRAKRNYESPVALTVDEAKAQASLAKAMDALGYKDVSEIPQISLVVAQGTDAQTACEFVSLSVEQALGIHLEVEPLEFGVRDSRIISGDYDLLLMGWGLDYPDASSIFTVFASDLFATGWPKAHPEEYNTYVEMMDSINTITDFAERGEKMLDMEAYLLERGPIMTMSLAGYPALMTQNINDFYIRDAGSRFDYIYASFK